jgi:phage terminase small subunit
MNALNNRQRAFVEHYLRTWNASESARLAGYSVKTAYSIGHELLKKPEVVVEIERRLEELKAGADEVITRLTDHARGTMETFIKIGDNGAAWVDLNQAREAGALHLVKKLKSKQRNLKDGETEYETEIELYDAQNAIVQLGRHHKLFTDKVEDDRVKALLDELADIRRRRAEIERARTGNSD